MRRILLVLVTLAVSLSASAKSAAELQLALRKLTVVGSALYVAAHPDDENTAMLAWLSNDRLYRTGYLSVTRGDGGQNLIGQEKGELLGVIRTQELLAARRIDGAEQFFTRAIDFGYSKSPEETLRIWGHDAVLADVVWVIRRFRPDVIVTRFPTTGEGGHGQHTASAMLAEEAFKAAGDATKFPEQLKYVTPWTPKRIFWNRFSWTPIKPDDPVVAKSLRVDLGTYNPLLGRAYTEIAAESRSEHKSQGFGSAERRGTVINYFDHRGGDPAAADLFEGVDTSWSRFPGGEPVGRLLTQAANSFDASKPAASIPTLMEALQLLERLAASWKDNPYYEVKHAELLNAIRDCAGLAIDVSASDSTVVAGAEIPVSVTVVNRSDYPFQLSVVASPFAAPGKAPGTQLKNNQPVKTDIVLRLPSDTNVSQPYWLQKAPAEGLFQVSDQELIGRADNAALPITVSLTDDKQRTLIYTVPAIFRWTDPVQGEKTRDLDVVPEVTATFESGIYVYPTAAARPVTLHLRSFGAKNAAVRLTTPAGWKSEPATQNVEFSGKGDEKTLTFTLTPPSADSTGNVTAEVGNASGFGILDIDYEHIPAQRLFPASSAKLVRSDIRIRGRNVGYVMGSGDDVPGVLGQMGYAVTLLSDGDLDRADFARYDAIVLGIRAYNTRDRLKQAHARLMDYVANGGTVVVQYNTANQLDDLAVPAPGPYPFKISRDRVTVESAPVQMLDATHPLLTAPNKITERDWANWVQERGLYFPSEWDPKYQTVIATNDPGEPSKPGGLLYAKHGKGAFVYTGYAWWRQLPAGVPGAMRLFANLVSAE
ncbi:MAG TPA: PIG-L family deacetylase [Thermoanaerobaculia bacterium]|jgi:LmbE family N-acetylglucosaminyl deacetylase